MKTIVVAYHSGYGHTKKQAEAVVDGIQLEGVTGILIDVSQIQDENAKEWEILDKADGIIFGSPTYMGSVSAQFKKFADLTSKKWFTKAWQNKIAGGFTNSASMNGDKFSTVQYLWTLAMQHAMIWVGLGLLPANQKSSTRDDINYMGGSGGALATSPSDSSPQEYPNSGDLETAKLYGQRIAQVAKKFN